MSYYRDDYVRDKYSSLISQLNGKRKSFCGIGTRKAKIRLNKLAKTDILAKLYRLALEVEDKNINAKAYPDYRDRYYEEKEDLLNDLVDLCVANNVIVGYQFDKSADENYEYPLMIVYFELPNCEQISWHTYIKPNCGKYAGVWDEKKESTLDKLEFAVLNQYPEINL